MCELFWHHALHLKYFIHSFDGFALINVWRWMRQFTISVSAASYQVTFAWYAYKIQLLKTLWLLIRIKCKSMKNKKKTKKRRFIYQIQNFFCAQFHCLQVNYERFGCLSNSDVSRVFVQGKRKLKISIKGQSYN